MKNLLKRIKAALKVSVSGRPVEVLEVKIAKNIDYERLAKVLKPKRGIND